MRRWGAILVGLSVIASYPACKSFGDADEVEPAPRVEAGADAIAEAGPPPGCTPKFPRDYEGCVCGAEAEVRDCDHGQTRPPSTCVKGSQQCSAGKWGKCRGATDPKTEVCFDAVDDDCDGELDNGCMGTAAFELCDALTDPTPSNTPRAVADKKSTYAKTDTVHLFVLWNRKIDRVDIRRADGSGCTGGFSQPGVVSPGKGCAAKGWFAFHVTPPAADGLFITDPSGPPSATDLQLLLNTTGNSPCQDEKASVTVTVQVNK